MTALDLTHDELCRLGERYLRIVADFKAVIVEPFTRNGERPDLAAYRNGVLTVVEVKVSAADFAADLKKPHRQHPELGLGYHRYYLTPEQITTPEPWPHGWGHLVTDGARVREIRESAAFRYPPTQRKLLQETSMLSAALERAQCELRLLEENARDTVGARRGVTPADEAWLSEIELLLSDGPLKLHDVFQHASPPFHRLPGKRRLERLKRVLEGSSVRMYDDGGRTMLGVGP